MATTNEYGLTLKEWLAAAGPIAPTLWSERILRSAWRQNHDPGDYRVEALTLMHARKA